MGANIGLLPDVSLQKTRMVGQVIENFGSRESITAKLDFLAGHVPSEMLWVPILKIYVERIVRNQLKSMIAVL